LGRWRRRDAERVSRFQREAEVLASVNHPHIAAIYELAEFDRFLVLEVANCLLARHLREKLFTVFLKVGAKGDRLYHRARLSGRPGSVHKKHKAEHKKHKKYC
jgi:hypothetical protein